MDGEGRNQLMELDSYGYIPLSERQKIDDMLINKNMHWIQKFSYPVGTQKLRKHN